MSTIAPPRSDESRDLGTVALEGLDFEPPCAAPLLPEHAAQFAVFCRCCRAVRLICRPHLEQLRAQLERKPRQIRVITCVECGFQAKDWDTVAEAVPL